MPRALKMIGKGLLVVVFLAVVAVLTAWGLTQRRLVRTYHVAQPAFTAPAVDDVDAVMRGRRLVNVVGACQDCHGKDFGGQVFVDSPIMGRLAGVNLTRGRGGIAASYTDADWARAMLHGVRRDGRSVVYMPSHGYRYTARELGDMVAYFRSLPAVDRELPPHRIGPLAAVLATYGDLELFPAELVDHQAVRFAADPPTADPVVQGEHLVSKSQCYGCHKPDFTGGGGPPPGATNITPVGIGAWSEHDFMRAIREHVRPNGTKIAEAMPEAYADMTDEELRAILAYLRTLPAKGEKHKAQL
jgi:mono/diheme cytochrome c family protein